MLFRSTLDVPEYFIMSVAWSPDGRTLAGGTWKKERGGTAGEVVLWDLAAGKELATLERHTGGVTAVAFSPEGATLEIGSGEESGPITAKFAAVRVWPGSTGLSKVTCNVTLSLARTSRMWGGTVSWVKSNKSVCALSMRLIEALSHGSPGSIP